MITIHWHLAGQKQTSPDSLAMPGRPANYFNYCFTPGLEEQCNIKQIGPDLVMFY